MIILNDLFQLSLDKRAVNAVSALGLAHVGDAVFELLVRSWLCAGGRSTPGGLHRATVRYVSAPAQAARAERMLPLLTEEELAWYHRGRNAHARHAAPRGATVQQYARASGLEAVFGALYLLGRRERISELFEKTMEET